MSEYEVACDLCIKGKVNEAICLFELSFQTVILLRLKQKSLFSYYLLFLIFKIFEVFLYL